MSWLHEEWRNDEHSSDDFMLHIGVENLKFINGNYSQKFYKYFDWFDEELRENFEVF